MSSLRRSSTKPASTLPQRFARAVLWCALFGLLALVGQGAGATLVGSTFGGGAAETASMDQTNALVGRVLDRLPSPDFAGRPGGALPGAQERSFQQAAGSFR